LFLMGVIVVFYFLEATGLRCHMMRLDIASVDEATNCFFFVFFYGLFFLMSMKDDLGGKGH
jgi:hypothetical protein